MASPPPTNTAAGRVAAIDYGTVRIGIAVSDSRRTIASPFENYTRRSKEADADYFRRLASEENIALFVVGLPVHLDGRESAKSREAPTVRGLDCRNHGQAGRIF